MGLIIFGIILGIIGIISWVVLAVFYNESSDTNEPSDENFLITVFLIALTLISLSYAFFYAGVSDLI
jgi:RsiW-degrading membrane proteinase PrsW (M82 family)